jgi:uncharacterized protein
LGLVLAVLAVAMVADRAVPDAHVAVGLGVAAWLVAITRTQGFMAADLGLAGSTWRTGLGRGAAAAALVGAAYALAYLVAPVREALPEGGGGIGRAALWAVLVVIPLGTVLPEELAFRGLLLVLLGRRLVCSPGPGVLGPVRPLARVLQTPGWTPDKAEQLREIITAPE